MSVKVIDQAFTPAVRIAFFRSQGMPQVLLVVVFIKAFLGAHQFFW